MYLEDAAISGEELDAENSGVVSYGSRIDCCSIIHTGYDVREENS